MRLLSLSVALAPSLVAAAPVTSSVTSSVTSLALGKILEDARPIFGAYVRKTGGRAEWMKNYHDSTPIVHMNIPGTHDASTWNYTQATQDALLGVTDLNGVVPYDPQFYRCQDVPFIDMLDGGIRIFDLRYALDPTNTSLVFYHSQALQSETATVEDVLYGFYQWLTDHPSEALFLSFQYEGSTAVHASNNALVQEKLFAALTSTAARQFFVQTKDRLGTLGQARGKITLLRRFDMDQVSSSYEEALPGLHFSPNLWTDNGVDIALTYNTADNLTAYIEDNYEPMTPAGSDAAENIRWKYNATTAHLAKAASGAAEYRDSLFWTWASSENDDNVPPEFPRIQALGNGSLTPDGGVNNQLVPFLKQYKGKRLGMVMFDFWEQPSNLIETFLDL